MTALTRYAQKKLLDHTINLASYSLPTTYLALLTAASNEDGTLTSEVSGGSYARQALSGKMAATVLATGIATNSATIVFQTPTAGWGTISHWAICDASSGGNALLYGALTFSKLVHSGALPPQFIAGALSILARSDQPNHMTQYLAKKWLDHILGIASFTAPTTIYLGLSRTDPGPTGVLTGEVAVGGYARQEVTSEMVATVLTTGIAYNSGMITFPTPSAAWPEVGYEFIADAAAAGNVLWRHARDELLLAPAGSRPVHVDALQLALRAA